MGSMADDLQRKSLKQIIPKIYKRHWLEGVLFGWIRGQKTLVNSVTIEQAIQSFYKDMDISEDDYPLQDCKTTYKRMTQEFYDNQKKPNSEEKE